MRAIDFVVQPPQLSGTSSAVTVIEDKFHNILLGGDQLTRARATGSLQLRCGGDRAKIRLEGIIPTIEDWHAKKILLGVSKLNTFLFLLFFSNCIFFTGIR